MLISKSCGVTVGGDGRRIGAGGSISLWFIMRKMKSMYAGILDELQHGLQSDHIAISMLEC